MNATTYSDMTIFKFVGLGQEAAANVLPVALDHVMHPLIQDSHFATEVYHVDQDGRQQGVVLSEMSEFSYREPSVRSLSLRRMLYPPSSTYAWESGGLLQEIEVLTTHEVEEYHKEFYNYQSLTLLLVGAYDKQPDAIFKALSNLNAEISAAPSVPRRIMPPLRTKKDKRRNDVLFPSEKSQTGTMGFAWEGPLDEDVETHVALEILLDFLAKDPASPLRKRFTNRAVPIAGDIEFSLQSFIPSMIELSFVEVPFTSYISHAAAVAASANASRRDSPALSSYPSPVDAFGPLDLAKLHDDLNSLYAPNYYRKQLISTMTYIVEFWLLKNWGYFHNYVTKQNLSAVAAFSKVAMDQKDHKGVLYMLAHDAVAYHHSPGFVDKTQPVFASRGNMFSIRRELEQKDCTFWQTLVQRWFMDNQMVHIAMIPDSRMGIQLEAERNLAQRNRIEGQEPEEAERHAKWLEEAIASTKIDIPHNVLADMPPIPDISKIKMPEFTGNTFRLDKPPFVPSPFGTGRVLVVRGETETKLQISFPLSGLASELRQYLPLFTRLLTSSIGLIIPCSFIGNMSQCAFIPELKPAGMPLIYMGSEQVDNAFGNAFTECKACIGDYLSSDDTGGWPVEVMTLYGATQSSDVNSTFQMLVFKLLFGDFGVDAILKAAKGQEKGLMRLKGTGASLLIDTYQWLRLPGPLDANTVADSDPSKSTVIECSMKEPLGRALNLYYQSSFISAVTKSLALAVKGDDRAAAQANRISSAISRIRAYFASSVLGTGLAHITLPYSLDRAEAQKLMGSLVNEWAACSAAWQDGNQAAIVPDSPYESTVLYNTSNKANGHPRKKRRSTEEDIPEPVVYSLPNKRAGSCGFTRLDAPLGIHLTLADLPTSYVGIQVPLNLQHGVADTNATPLEYQLEKLPEIDVWALTMLTTIFNRSEGLVKNAVRGRGYAYGVGIHPRPADGHLAVYISHSSDPQKALEAFWEVLELLRSEDEWNKAIDEVQLNAARSIVLFRTYNNAAQAVALEDARWMFNGYGGLDERILWVRRHVERVTVADLRRVFQRHFVPIITKDPHVKALYLVVIPQFLADSDRDPLSKLQQNQYGIVMKHIDFAFLDPVVKI
ncbi:hypothetical protein IW140_001530 [Coemansia sp. RSA 1813]|nr:hypothetical protein IW138_005479 [Coemansia sp. RSA 986]KAJ2571612.1 hypothetical protein IW140_001530 [Coemansia sp. RSA 1813]